MGIGVSIASPNLEEFYSLIVCLLFSLFLVSLLLLQNGPNIPDNSFAGTVTIIPINLKVAFINIRIIVQTVANIINKMQKTFLCCFQCTIALPFIFRLATLCTRLFIAIRRLLFPYGELGKCRRFITVAVATHRLLICPCFRLPPRTSFYPLVPLQFQIVPIRLLYIEYQTLNLKSLPLSLYEML